MSEIQKLIDEVVSEEKLQEARMKSAEDRTLDDWRLLFEDSRKAWASELEVRVSAEQDAERLAYYLQDAINAQAAIKRVERSFQDFLVNTDIATRDEVVKIVTRIARQYLADIRARIDEPDDSIKAVINRHFGDLPF